MVNDVLKIWEESWDKNTSSPSSLVRELGMPDSIGWRKIISGIKSHFGSIHNLRVIEIGAGLGRAGARLAREGADVTLADFSPGAIAKAREFFEEAGLKADFLICDILKLPEKVKESFDLSISFGVVEHFASDDRKKAFSIHADILREGGAAIIGTPNAYGFPYIIWMAFAKLLGAWEVGYEVPYTAGEIREIMNGLGYRYRRWGTPFSETLNTYIINKLNISLTNLMLLGKLRARDERKRVYRFIPLFKDRRSFLDDIFGYHIIFVYK